MTAIPERGIVQGLSHDDYHAHHAVSKSGLDRLERSPAHFRAYISGQDKDTEAKRFGRLCHLAILEPDRFAAETVLSPEINRRTNKGKAEWEDFCRMHAGMEIVTTEDMETLRHIQESVLSHPTAGGLLSCRGTPEVSAFWTDQGDKDHPATGISCRCRPDLVLGGGVIVDLKSARDASPRGFERAVAEHRYHVQQAFYLDGYAAAGGFADTFLFIAFEKEAPFACCVHQLQAKDVAEGRAAYRRNLETLASCRAENHWPAYADDIVQITLPAWARKEMRI
ncbi:PD-(D/E)XK nuclease-like domain-containing protein [Solidesulfovibrio sp. C21]|uniref:PD-(D/E)XK nuclease-like domain-containing protein n=1 Tax=Solidesulfovibrio sp. C21 TaxID=3398613 RepID=UPI0039FD5AA8